MKIQRRKFLQMTSCGVLALEWPLSARAERYPSRPVHIEVGFPAGGPLDIAARTIAPFLSDHFGTDFTVDNRPGASGNTATSHVIRAAPDGYTLLLCGPVNVINMILFENLDFEFSRDVAAVAAIASVPLIVEVNPAMPIRSVPELLAFASNNPRRLRVGFAGIGTPQHVAIELFQMMSKVRVTLVPYAGSTPALDDLLKGEIDAMFDPAPSSMPLIHAGRLVPIATTGPTRTETLPEVPAMSEFLTGYIASSWFGLAAPRGTSADVVELLNAGVNAALADHAVRARFRELSATIKPGSAADFRHFIDLETDKYRDVIRSAGIKPA